MIKLAKNLTIPKRAIRVINIASYIPRKCGIATYTKDLTNAINLLNPYSLAEIMAVNEPNSNHDYPWEVKFRINQDDLRSYLDAASYINQSGTQVVHLQHEFGLFGGSEGEYIVQLVKHIKKPLIITLHTVLDNPRPNMVRIIQELASSSQIVTVMVGVAAQRLMRRYEIPKGKIFIIPHGVPDLPFGPSLPFKEKLGLGNYKIMGVINLLSRNKGLEYAISAVPKILKKFPNFLFLVIGETHPQVKRTEGESYRRELGAQVKKLKIEKNVRFINEYLSLDDLTTYLRSFDIYITPYLDPSQTASGTLAYAIGAGKNCISTPYLYAKEILWDGRGILVPFRNPDSIGEAAIKILESTSFALDVQKKAYDFGRLMIWPSVALSHLDLYQALIEKKRNK